MSGFKPSAVSNQLSAKAHATANENIDLMLMFLREIQKVESLQKISGQGSVESGLTGDECFTEI